MKISFLKLRITLFFAVMVLFISVFSNRVTLAKSSYVPTTNFAVNNLPAEFVFTTNLSGITRSVFQKINYQRKRKGLKPLLWNEDLGNVAYDYSEIMAEEDFFGHVDNDGNSVAERVDNYGLTDWSKIGENLFECIGYPDVADEAVKGWLSSPTHKENIFDADWTQTGIGVFKTREGRTYVTQIFMRK